MHLIHLDSRMKTWSSAFSQVISELPSLQVKILTSQPDSTLGLLPAHSQQLWVYLIGRKSFHAFSGPCISGAGVNFPFEETHNYGSFSGLNPCLKYREKVVPSMS
jgi:hypothetical protein